MNKFGIIIAAIALLGVACNKEQTIVDNQSLVEQTSKRVRIELKVIIDPETSATMDGRRLTFGMGDEIGLIACNAVGKAEAICLTVSSISDGVITFSAEVDEGTQVGDYAYYPKEIIPALSNVDFEDVDQTLVNWNIGFDGTAVQIPMMAKIDTEHNTAEFKHLGAMLKVNLVNMPAGVSVLKFNTSNPVFGTYSVNTETWSTTYVSGGVNSVSVSVSGNGLYFIPVPTPANVSYGDFSLSMTDNVPYIFKQRTANLSSPITPARGQIVNMGNFAYDVDEIATWWHVSDINGWQGGYNRYIKTGLDTYQLTAFNPGGNPWWYFRDGDGDQWGIPGHNNYWSGTIEKCNDTFNRTDSANKTFWVTLTKNGNSWQYDSGNWEYNSDRELPTDGVSLSTGLDYDNDGPADWDNITFSKYNYGANYSFASHGLVIPDNEMYEFKFVTSGGVWCGGSDVFLTDAAPYGKAVWSGGDNMKFQLTPGTYDIYLDVAELNFMFVKQ